jgi:hypothetical protein
MKPDEKEAIRARDAAEYAPGRREASAKTARAIEDRHDLLAEVDRLTAQLRMCQDAYASVAVEAERARILAGLEGLRRYPISRFVNPPDIVDRADVEALVRQK